LLVVSLVSALAAAQQMVTPDEARSIAKVAYVYGLSMVDN